MPIPGTPLAAGDFLEVTVYCYDPDTTQLGLNVSYWIAEQVVDVFTDSQVAGKFDDLFAPLYKNIMAPDVNYYGVKVALPWRSPPPAPKLSITHPGPGLYDIDDGITDPGQLAALSTFKADLRGRKGRARKYWPFLPEEAYDENNRIVVDFKTAVDFLTTTYAGFVNFTTGVDLVTLSPIIVHRPLVYTEPPLFDRIYEGVTSDYIATQRRRGHYGRPNTLPV